MQHVSYTHIEGYSITIERTDFCTAARKFCSHKNHTTMQANIKAIHFDISEKLVNFVNKKVDKLSRRFDAVTEVEVTMKVVKPETAMNKEASIKLSVPPAADLFASKTADTFEEAVDLCIAALEPQLEKNKERK